MRLDSITSAVLAALLALPVAAGAQGYSPAPQRSGPLSSIFGCEASGNKQAGGAVLGGVLGGVVGSNVSKHDRGLGTAVGAALGAAAGSYVGCRMQASDQRRATAAAQDALDRNASQSWTNPETGASGSVHMVSTEPYGGGRPVSMNGLRLASGVELASNYEGAGGRYTARRAANIRSAPSTSARVVGKLQAGKSIDALARVSGSEWLLAGRNGMGIGYVSDTTLRANGGSAGQTYAGGGSNRVCRTFDQTFTGPNGAPETQRYRACQGANGEWAVQS